ncbi:MAG: glycosyltransferase family 1 protein [Candidatus Harrisonbacteria bacterium]|nr:glycosyltransferase family 1 protein [Candidatus Harrisonbacteria bacterium]
MRIAYFIGTLKKGDGVARVVTTLAREAQQRGVESVIVTGFVESQSISPVPTILIPSVKFPLYKEYKLPLPGMGGFEKKLKEFNPDVIHIHSPDTIAFAAAKYAKKYNVPIFATHHTDFSRYLSYYHINFLNPVLWAILRRLYSKVRMVTVPSDWTNQDLNNHGIRNVTTVPWGVDFKSFAPSFRSEQWRKSILKRGEQKILVSVSRLTWEKDLKTLAEAYKLLQSAGKKFQMVIAGDGPARKEFEEMMPGAVFLGYIDKEKLSEVFASSDILLFPSSTETFGQVTLEAMASGAVPVVADQGGSATIVENGKNGLIAQTKNPQSFCEKTLNLLNDENLLNKMKKAGLKSAKRYSWPKVLDQIFEIYRN